MLRLLRVVLLLHVTMTLTCSTVGAQEQWQWLDEYPNLIQNPGFEELNESGWAVGWKITPAPVNAAEVTIDTQAPGGRQALRIHHIKDSYEGIQQTVEIEPDASYFLRFDVYGEMIEQAAPANMGAVVRLEAGEKSVSVGWSRRIVGSTLGWKQIALTAEPVNFGEATQVEVVCKLNRSRGTAWFDNIVLVKAGPEWQARRAQERQMRIFRKDVEAAVSMADEARDRRAMTQLNRLAQRVEAEHMPAAPDLREGPPYSDPERELLQIMARLNSRRLKEKRPLVVWQVDPFAPVHHFGLVPTEEPDGIAAQVGDYTIPIQLPKVPGAPASATMGRGETEQIALNLCNLTGDSMTVSVSLQAQEDGPALLLREAIPVQTRREETMADPLPRLGETGAGGEIVLPPGLFKQIWVMIDSRAVSADDYSALLKLDYGRAEMQVPLNIDVLPVDFPAETPVVTWSYSYKSSPLISDRWAQARPDLVAHHINAYCWPAQYLPWPTFDDQGRLQPLDWTRFDEGLATHDNIRWLLLWPQFEMGDYIRLHDANLKVGSAEWERRFTLWFQAMLEGLEQRGFGSDRIAWYLSDEPCNWERANAVETTGSVIKRIAPEALILANPYQAIRWPMLTHMDPVVDIWTPELTWADGHLLQFFREGSQILWSYQVLPRQEPAFTRYRRSFWDCWSKGITGQGFWSYVDLSGSNWDPWDEGGADYAVIYDGDPDELIPSVRWEAWREGTEDYTYLHMLRQAREERRGENSHQARAEQLVSGIAAETAHNDQPEALSAVREEILRVLAAMQP